MSRMKEVWYEHGLVGNSLRLLRTLENAEKLSAASRLLAYGTDGVRLIHIRLRENLEEMEQRLVDSTNE